MLVVNGGNGKVVKSMDRRLQNRERKEYSVCKCSTNTLHAHNMIENQRKYISKQS